tara:strand:- start:13 stop:408 length:396 start_codon:yes stop_codon:yes gene_type:complete
MEETMTEEIDNLLDYMRRAGLNTISTNSPAWKLLHNTEKTSKINKNLLTCQKFDISIGLPIKKLDISIGYENGQKLTVGQLVRHRTVPQLGLGLVVGESKTHKNYWIVKWCDPRYYDVGSLGIDREYLEIV